MPKLLFCALPLLFGYLSEGQNNNSTQSTANSTEIPLNETNASNSTEIPTKEPMNTTSMNEAEDKPLKYYYDEYCVCDLRLNWCDINCCCDVNCDEWQRASFDHCIDTRKQVHDSRYCSNKNVVYINNTDTKVEVSSNGLFCIVWDNTGQTQVFDNRKLINDANRLLNIRAQHNYKWNPKSVPDIKWREPQVGEYSSQMKAGRSVLVWRELNDKKVDWELPIARVITDGECNSFYKVQYLIDFNSSCYRSVPNLDKHWCETNYFLKSHQYQSLKFVPKIFLNESDTIDVNWTQVETEPPFYDSENKVCKNAVQSVHYTIVHNGSEGIIEAEVALKTVELKSTTKWLKQTFAVTFLWLNKSNVVEVSGKPGYIVGKPILTAFYSKDINLKQNVAGYEFLTLSDGFCDNFVKKPIEFGTNWRSGCLLRVNIKEKDVCDSIQRVIWSILEPHPNLDMIGVFGNSSIANLTDWTKILNVGNASIDGLNDDNCPTLVTGVSLYIYYAVVGTAVQPQHKIIGAVKNFRTQNKVRVKCPQDLNQCEDIFVELSASVTFIDISHPSRSDYAPPVTFKVQLPSDFFYPFLTNSKESIRANILIDISIPFITSVFYVVLM